MVVNLMIIIQQFLSVVTSLVVVRVKNKNNHIWGTLSHGQI